MIRGNVTKKDGRPSGVFSYFSPSVANENIYADFHPSLPIIESFTKEGRPIIRSISSTFSIGTGFKYQIYLPFTAKGILVSDWANGVFELFPAYTIVYALWDKVSPMFDIQYAVSASTQLIYQEFTSANPAIKNEHGLPITGNISRKIIWNSTFVPSPEIEGVLYSPHVKENIMKTVEYVVDLRSAALTNKNAVDIANDSGRMITG